MAKKKKHNKQLPIDFKGAENNSPPESSLIKNEQNKIEEPSKVIYFDPRQDIYRKILSRQMK